MVLGERQRAKKTRLRLVLTKGLVFTTGIFVLIAGAILADLFPHGGKFEPNCIITTPAIAMSHKHTSARAF